MQWFLAIVLTDLEWKEKSEFKNKQEKEKGRTKHKRKIRQKRMTQFSSREPFMAKDIATTD